MRGSSLRAMQYVALAFGDVLAPKGPFVIVRSSTKGQAEAEGLESMMQDRPSFGLVGGKFFGDPIESQIDGVPITGNLFGTETAWVLELTLKDVTYYVKARAFPSEGLSFRHIDDYSEYVRARRDFIAAVASRGDHR